MFRVVKIRMPEMASYLVKSEISVNCNLKERQAVMFPVTVFRLCLIGLRSLVHVLSELCY